MDNSGALQKSNEGIGSLLRLYTLCEHLSTFGIDDPNHFLSAGRDVDRLAQLADEVSKFMTDHTGSVADLWRAVAERLRVITGKHLPISKSLVHATYLLTTYTWYSLDFQRDPSAEAERKAQCVCLHPATMLVPVIKIDVDGSVDLEDAIHHLLNRHADVERRSWLKRLLTVFGPVRTLC